MNQLTNSVKSILMETARNLGIQVLETPFLNCYDAGIYGLYTRYKGVDVIIISSNVSQEEQTFTLAHELAHYILHREDLGDRYCRYRYWNDNRYQTRKEAEADYFAWKLLSFIYKEFRVRKRCHWLIQDAVMTYLIQNRNPAF